MGEKSSLVSRNVEKVAQSLFAQRDQQQRFLDALSRRDAAVTAVVTLRGSAYLGSGAHVPPWLPPWITVAGPEDRPGKSDRHEEGDLYCFDLSSTFACAAYSCIEGPGSLLVDLCAAPGGKSIVASRYLAPQCILANEVIRKRTAQLISNYKRCLIDPAMVTSRDPGTLAKLVPGSAHVVVVDAPCSGQSLVLKDLAAPGAFHPATISMNARRQRRILACAAEMVQPGGYIVYSTCTFSREENEENVEWFLKKHPKFSAVAVPLLGGFLSPYLASPTYRLFPFLGYGAGSFCALLRSEPVPAPKGAEGIADLTDRIKPLWRSPRIFELCPVPVGSGDREEAGRPGRRKWDRRGQRSARRVKRSRSDYDE